MKVKKRIIGDSNGNTFLLCDNQFLLHNDLETAVNGESEVGRRESQRAAGTLDLQKP